MPRGTYTAMSAEQTAEYEQMTVWTDGFRDQLEAEHNRLRQGHYDSGIKAIEAEVADIPASELQSAYENVYIESDKRASEEKRLEALVTRRQHALGDAVLALRGVILQDPVLAARHRTIGRRIAEQQVELANQGSDPFFLYTLANTHVSSPKEVEAAKVHAERLRMFAELIAAQPHAAVLVINREVEDYGQLRLGERTENTGPSALFTLGDEALKLSYDTGERNPYIALQLPLSCETSLYYRESKDTSTDPNAVGDIKVATTTENNPVIHITRPYGWRPEEQTNAEGEETSLIYTKVPNTFVLSPDEMASHDIESAPLLVIIGEAAILQYAKELAKNNADWTFNHLGKLWQFSRNRLEEVTSFIESHTPGVIEQLKTAIYKTSFGDLDNDASLERLQQYLSSSDDARLFERVASEEIIAHQEAALAAITTSDELAAIKRRFVEANIEMMTRRKELVLTWVR